MSTSQSIYLGPYAKVERRGERVQVDKCADHNRGDAKFCPECGRDEKKQHFTRLVMPDPVCIFTDGLLVDVLWEDSKQGTLSLDTVIPNCSICINTAAQRTGHILGGSYDEKEFDILGIGFSEEAAWFIETYDWAAIKEYYGTDLTFYWGVVAYIS